MAFIPLLVYPHVCLLSSRYFQGSFVCSGDCVQKKNIPVSMGKESVIFLEDNFDNVQMNVTGNQDYILISELDSLWVAEGNGFWRILLFCLLCTDSINGDKVFCVCY